MRADIESAVRQAAEAHKIEPAALLAVVDIESAGAPFEAADGVTPCFLFERHIFYRELKQRAPGKLQTAINQGLANTSWQPSTQYKDQGTSAKRLALLAKAASVDPESAYRSASWGLGQTMGFHAEGLGYPSAQAMVEAMKGNIPVQVEAMIGEINRSNLGTALANHNWAAFAKGYNGPAYAKNAYDTRLAQAYSKWTRAGVALPPKPSEEIKWIQSALNKLGAELTVDGFEGPRTHLAIIDFQEEHDLDQDGIVGKLTRAKIEEQLSLQTQENDPMSTWFATIFLKMLGSSQIQSLVRKLLTMVGTALLLKVGLDAGTASSILNPIIEALAGVVTLGSSFFLSAQNASDQISNPTLIKLDTTPTA